MSNSPCVVCKKPTLNHGWFLNGYHGLSGHFCAACYEKVSHDPYGEPHHPRQFRAISKKLQVKA